MLSALLRQGVNVIALGLVGVGLSVGPKLLGLGDLATFVGVLLVAAAAFIVAATTFGWNLEVIRTWRSGGPFRGYELLDPWFFRVVSAGFIGLGLVLGSATSTSPAMLVGGIAGLVVLALMREQRAS